MGCLSPTTSLFTFKAYSPTIKINRIEPTTGKLSLATKIYIDAVKKTGAIVIHIKYCFLIQQDTPAEENWNTYAKNGFGAKGSQCI